MTIRNIISTAAIGMSAVGMLGFAKTSPGMASDQASSPRATVQTTPRWPTTAEFARRRSESLPQRRPHVYYRPRWYYGPYYRENNGWYPDYFWSNFGGNYEGVYHGYPYDAIGFMW